MRSMLAPVLFWIAATLSAPTWALDLLAAPVRQSEQSRTELLVHAPQGVAAGQPLWVGLRIEHAPHWHSYWMNPGDSGLPTTLQWTLPPGVQAGDVAWPTPRKFPIGDLANYGYDGTVLLPVPLTVPADFNAPVLEVALDARWLICRQECIPEEGHFRVQIPTQGSTALNGAAFDAAWAAAPKPLATGNSRLTVQGDQLTLALHGLPAPWRGQTLEWFPETAGLIRPGAAWTQAWQGPVWTASVPLSPERSASPTQVPLVVSLAAPASNPNTPVGVRLETPVTGTWPAVAAAEQVSPELQAALDRNAARVATSTAPIDVGLWGALLGALVGGLILNLMPCVFPVLAIKVLAFARQGDNHRLHRLSGLAYTLGVVASFLALGGLLVGLRSAGAALGWGFQLQQPGVVAALALLFTLIGLNLSGGLELGWVLPGRLSGLQARHPAVDACLSGVLAAAIASPCTAPFMGAALGLAVGLPTPQALAVFGTLGLGMALPYLLASFLPGVARMLPRPGPWMVTLRQALAFPMFGTVVWLLWVLGQQSGIDGAAALLALLLGVGAWVWTLSLRGRSRWVFSVGALAVLLGLTFALGPYVTRVQPLNRASAPQDSRWQRWTPETQAEVLAAGRPVFVDFTAAWCVTCQYNKHTTLADPEVLQDAATHQVALLRADWTQRDPVVTEALRQLGRNGVPVYALYAPGQPPVVLTEILSVAEVRAALARL